MQSLCPNLCPQGSYYLPGEEERAITLVGQVGVDLLEGSGPGGKWAWGHEEGLMGRMEVKESQAFFPPIGRNRTSKAQSVCVLATKNIRLEYWGGGHSRQGWGSTLGQACSLPGGRSQKCEQTSEDVRAGIKSLMHWAFCPLVWLEGRGGWHLGTR